jgi:hypothetical protein
MATTIQLVTLGVMLCLFGYVCFSKFFRPSEPQSAEPSTSTSPNTTVLEERVEILEKEAETLRALRRQLELEWEDTSQRLRSALGRLDKHAAREEKKAGRIDGTGTVTDTELAARLFGRKLD